MAALALCNAFCLLLLAYARLTGGVLVAPVSGKQLEFVLWWAILAASARFLGLSSIWVPALYVRGGLRLRAEVGLAFSACLGGLATAFVIAGGHVADAEKIVRCVFPFWCSILVLACTVAGLFTYPPKHYSQLTPIAQSGDILDYSREDLGSPSSEYPVPLARGLMLSGASVVLGIIVLVGKNKWRSASIGFDSSFQIAEIIFVYAIPLLILERLACLDAARGAMRARRLMLRFAALALTGAAACPYWYSTASRTAGSLLGL